MEYVSCQHCDSVLFIRDYASFAVDETTKEVVEILLLCSICNKFTKICFDSQHRGLDGAKK